MAKLATKAPAPGAAKMHAPGLADGVYLYLDEETYHNDSALGSTDLRSLLKGANEYWWRSEMNPKRPPVMSAMTDGKIIGKAMHKLLLEGEKLFAEGYVRRPDDPTGSTPAEKGQRTKDAKKRLMEGQDLIHGDDYDFLLGVKSVIDEDPELVGCLDGGLSEVSVFWTRPDGIRCKARYDKLKLRGIGDIKSIANERGRELSTACRLDIHTYRYDIPAAHYLESRRHLPGLVTANRVFVGTMPYGDLDDPDPHTDAVLFLTSVAKQKEFAFQLVFVPKTGAPDAWSCTLSPGNEILMLAETDISVAIDVYKMAIERFGTGRWLPMRGVQELAIEEMPVGFGRR